MADAKVSALTELTTFTGDEEFYVVEDDDGTPVSRRITVENLATGLAARTEFTSAFTPSKSGAVITDQPLTSSSTTLQNLTNLSFAINGVTNQIWFVEVYLIFVTANATMDGKFAFSVPGAVTGDLFGHNSGSTSLGYGTWGPQTTATSATTSANSLTTAVAFGSVNARFGVSFSAIVIDGGTSGTVQAQAAQNTSDAGAITLKKGSCLLARRVA